MTMHICTSQHNGETVEIMLDCLREARSAKQREGLPTHDSPRHVRHVTLQGAAIRVRGALKRASGSTSNARRDTIKNAASFFAAAFNTCNAHE